MKTLNDIKQDMSTLYDEFKDGKIDRNNASELANIAGKNLKAHQLELANKIFLAGGLLSLPAPDAKNEK